MELFIFGLIILVLILFFLIHYFQVLMILQVGIFLMAGGLLFGIPAGCYYHYLFFSRKKQADFKAEKWWVSPYKYHKHFSAGDQKLLNRWFFTGAFFFNTSIAGAVFIFLYFVPIS